MSGRVAIVTDSTASLPAELAHSYDVTIVPLAVAADDSPETTSRPAAEQLRQVYQSALAGDAEAVLSVHLSGQLSGTVAAARLAAAEWGDQVTVVDSQTIAMGLGFSVLAAADVVRNSTGADSNRIADAVSAIHDTVSRSTSVFYVDDLEYLRRSGRIGVPALSAGVLAVRLILHVVKGGIAVKDRVRTRSQALTRLEELAVTTAGDSCQIAVQHLGTPDVAAELASRLRVRIPQATRFVVSEVDAVVGAHVGPGTVGVVVAP